MVGPADDGSASIDEAIRRIVREELRAAFEELRAAVSAPATTALGSEYMNTERAADLLGLSKVTLEQWRCRGEGPPFRRLGRSIRYARADLVAWCDGHDTGAHQVIDPMRAAKHHRASREQVARRNRRGQ